MKHIIIITLLLSGIVAHAQCYEPNLRKADAEYAKCNYSQAYEYYRRATKCPDASRFENGKAAKAGMRKCKPSLLLDGKEKVEFNCSPEAGSKTLKVYSSKLTGWRVCGVKGGGKCVVDSTNGTITYYWRQNNTIEKREIGFHLHGDGGAESAYASFTLHQAGWPDSTATLKPGEKYDTVIKGENGITFVVLRGKCGYIDSLGNEITPLKYDYEKKASSYNSFTGYQEKWYRNTILVRVKRKGKYGLIDKTGKEIVPLIYDTIYVDNYDYGFESWPVKKNGKWGLLNGLGKEIVPCQYSDYSLNNNYNYDYPVYFSNSPSSRKFALFDRDGNQLTDFIIEEFTYGFSGFCNLAPAKINGKYGYINKKGEIVIRPQFEFAEEFSGNRAEVTKQNKIGYINTDGEVIIPIVYDKNYYNIFLYGINIAEKKEKYGIIDTMGNKIANFVYDNINRDFYSGFSIAQKKGRTIYLSIIGDEFETKESAENNQTTIFLKAAEMGIIRGQEFMSDYYLKNQDTVKALLWRKKAAEQGNPYDQYLLAKMYYYGYGTEKKYHEAFVWFKKAANNDNSEAMQYLAWMLWYGQGCEINKQSAIEWERKAIRAGNNNAITDMKTLGMNIPNLNIKPF